MKVFGIGLSKTGTSTLRAALEILGYRMAHNAGLMQQVAAGELDEAFARIEKYDGVEDMPWPLMFEEIFEKYGADARYILTVRESTERWLRSFKTNSLNKDPFKKLRQPIVTYGRRYPFGFEDEFTAFYEKHNERVREFFRERKAEHALLEVCWEKGDGWEKLCAFLGHDPPDAPLPAANVTAQRKNYRGRRWANAVLAHIIARSQGRRVKDRLFVSGGS